MSAILIQFLPSSLLLVCSDGGFKKIAFDYNPQAWAFMFTVKMKTHPTF